MEWLFAIYNIPEVLEKMIVIMAPLTPDVWLDTI